MVTAKVAIAFKELFVITLSRSELHLYYILVIFAGQQTAKATTGRILQKLSENCFT